MTKGPLLVISVDCECDKSADWTSARPASFLSITEAIPTILQPLLGRRGLSGTYLLSSEVLEDDASCAALSQMEGTHELGAHLHGDYIGPGRTHVDFAGSLTSEYQCDYHDELQRAKLESLTDMFTSRFGYGPTSFRAGRFGANPYTLRALEELGYLVDSSVLPGHFEHTACTVIDYRRAPNVPYVPVGPGHRSAGVASIVEVPVSVSHGCVARFLLRNYHSTSPGRIFQRLTRGTVLRPTWNTSAVLIAAARRLVGQGVPVINVMFHSMELVPGASPYAEDQAGVRGIVGSLEGFLDWWIAEGYSGCTLSEARPLALGLQGEPATSSGGDNGPRGQV